LRFKQILLWMFTVFETRFVQWDPIQQIAWAFFFETLL
jgi:hypothetical protein